MLDDPARKRISQPETAMRKRLTSRPIFWVAIGIVAVVLGVPLLIGMNYFGRYTGLTVPEMTPAEKSALLAPTYDVHVPEGEGPFPTVLMFSGCDGPADNLQTWTQAMLEQGWATIIVDSHGPRGFTDDARWRLICAGQLLTGAERAGDVAVAIDDARAMDFVDDERIALIGASHGGWAVLEYLSMADHGQVPLTLTQWPDTLAGDPLDGISGAVLLYPFCGKLSRAARRGWESPVPVLFLLADGDRIAPERDCLKIAEREAAEGLPVSSQVFAGVTHGFDQRNKAPMSALRYDEQATGQALESGTEFLGAAFGETTTAMR